MRRELVFALLLIAAGISSIGGRLLPLTTKDIGLMLRSGYSSEAIQKDLAARHFAGSCDAAAEKSLMEAGATRTLVDTIKSGVYQVSPEEERAAKEELASQASRRQFEAEQSRQFNTLYQDKLRRARAAGFPSSEPTTTSALIDLIKGDLVSMRNGGLNRFDDEPLGKVRLVAFYTAARWCSSCHSFTPRLIEFYKRMSPQHPEFEIVFLSKDRSPGEMEIYMRESQMPWPAVDFDKLRGKEGLRKYERKGLPCLVLLDPSGKVISDSYVGEAYVGPEKVLKDLESIVSKNPPAVAASR